MKTVYAVTAVIIKPLIRESDAVIIPPTFLQSDFIRADGQDAAIAAMRLRMVARGGFTNKEIADAIIIASAIPAWVKDEL